MFAVGGDRILLSAVGNFCPLFGARLLPVAVNRRPDRTPVGVATS
jgi:hypothetical protein